MENFYTSYSKIVQNQLYFFVKKFLRFPEFTNVPDVLVGYGMHIDFDKACSIATVEDPQVKQQLFNSLQDSTEQAKVIEMKSGTFEIKTSTR